jgi:peptidoglycan/LPS O-acetylase OafA/YrhL
MTSAARHARAPVAGWSQPVLHGQPAASAKVGAHHYSPGLDGMRAIAVSSVVIYHLGAGWLPGGFLGVDIFFVLSGFLITSLLVNEWQTSGRIDIRRFYVRRARRLLPALYLMLATVVFATAVIAPSQLSRLRGDVVAALFYVTNWTQILWNRSYFQALGPPSLLEHLWSLAVEEQFYFTWPLVLVACLATRRRALPIIVAVAGTALSALLMAALYSPFHDPSRVYYGSDTHATPILIGAVLALARATSAPRGRRVRRPTATWPLDLLALGAAIVLTYYLVHVGYVDSALYRGGYVIVGLATVMIIQAALRADTVCARLLGRPLLRWIGLRSYAIYLWHWPIIQLTRPELHPPVSGLVLDAFRIALSVGAAAISYRFVEHPIRTRGFLAVVRGARPALAPIRSLLAVAAIGAVLVAGSVQLAHAPSTRNAGIEFDHAAAPTITISHAAHTAEVSSTPPAAGSTSAPAPPPPPPPFGPPVKVGFFGDSQGMTLLINKPAGLEGSLILTDDTIEGCGILGGRTSSVSGQSRNLDADCGGWQQTWTAHAARDKPQIAVVEIGAWEVFDLKVNGVALAFGSPAWDQYFSSQLASGINVLTAAGAQVALLSIPCYQPITAGGLQALPERGDRSRTDHLNALLGAAAAANPKRVFMVTSPSQFCDDPKVAGNTAYRWDGTHFYKAGAALEFQVITPQLLAIPQPPR